MTRELNYFKESIHFIYSHVTDKFLHKKEKLLDEFDQELITSLANGLNMLKNVKKYEIPIVYQQKLFVSYSINTIGKYLATSDEDFLKKLGEIVFNADIMRSLPLNSTEPYMKIVFKKMSDLVLKNEASKHKQFFNECIQIFLNNHKNKDLFPSKADYSNEEMYQDTCNQLAVQNESKYFSSSLLFEICKLYNPDDENENLDLKEYLAIKRSANDSPQIQTKESSKIIRFDQDKDFCSKRKVPENIESIDKENSLPVKSSSKSSLNLSNSKKNSDSIVDSPRKLALCSPKRTKVNLNACSIYFDDVFYSNEQATTSKESKPKKYLKRPKLLKSLGLSDLNQDSDSDGGSDLDFDKSSLGDDDDDDDDEDSNDNLSIKKKTIKTVEITKNVEEDSEDEEEIKQIDKSAVSTASYYKKNKSPKKKISWTETETFYLVYGYLVYENSPNIWAKILETHRNKFNQARNSVSLKDKWRNLQNSIELPQLKRMAQAQISKHEKS